MTVGALDALLAGLTDADGGARVAITPDWMQGRTAYGGLSAALVLAAVQRQLPAAPPLRCAQFNFVGPVGGECRISSRVVRQSKSSLFVDAAITGDDGAGTSALITFSPLRDGHLHHPGPPMPDVPPPAGLESVPQHPMRPVFTQHFDMRPVGGLAAMFGQDVGRQLTWVRFVDPPACDPAVALLALGDALPPAAMALFRKFGPVSSMNWTVTMLADAPTSADGWWLLDSHCDHAVGGLSVQQMTVWNAAGEAVVAGSQAVAIYC